MGICEVRQCSRVAATGTSEAEKVDHNGSITFYVILPLDVTKNFC